MRTFILSVLVLGCVGLTSSHLLAAQEATTWKAGVASVKVTPETSVWMAGYAARTKPSEGVAQDLFAKALAIEDAHGTRLVIVTMDLIGVPRGLRDWLEKEVRDKRGLEPRSLLVNASHTHCGPGCVGRWLLERRVRLRAFPTGAGRRGLRRRRRYGVDCAARALRQVNRRTDRGKGAAASQVAGRIETSKVNAPQSRNFRDAT